MYKWGLSHRGRDGVDKMAKYTLLDASGYMEWSTKLTSKDMDEATKITNKYTDLAFGSINDQLDAAISGFDFNF